MKKTFIVLGSLAFGALAYGTCNDTLEAVPAKSTAGTACTNSGVKGTLGDPCTYTVTDGYNKCGAQGSAHSPTGKSCNTSQKTLNVKKFNGTCNSDGGCSNGIEDTAGATTVVGSNASLADC